MSHKSRNKKILSIFLVGLSVFILLSSFYPASKVYATGVPVVDVAHTTVTETNWLTNFLKTAWQKIQDIAGSKLLTSVVGQAMNQIAYQSATWLGGGNKGQKPMFVTKGWGSYLADIADNAAGSYIQQLGQEGAWGTKFNLCKPDLNIRLKIGFGLVSMYKPSKPGCKFSEMKKNWQKELSSGDFLNNFQDMFNPQSNEFGAALTLQSGIMAEVNKIGDTKLQETVAKKGWLDITGLDGRVSNIPGIGEQTAELIQAVQTAPLLKDYKDEFTQAANIFLNQLAITLINEKLKTLGKGDTSSDAYDWSTLTEYSTGPTNRGIAGVEDQLRKIVQPDFSSRGDYNILSELTICANAEKAGPTNCVIDDKFRQAVQEKLTVSEALSKGYLLSDGVFGYNSNGLEPSYKEGYPYRSIIILRKYRIIPVGWELASLYIKDNLNAIGGSKNISDLVACFDSSDNYEGYYAAWCEGLVDPDWLLKAPQNYCRREGPGPEIMTSSVSGETTDSKIYVSRNDKYCADEQSCIKEKADGSCQLYGYCTEERRKWNFGAEDCEPKYNTCQTFKSEEGRSVTYLENTLDYEGCSVDNAGCKAYCTDYDYADGRFACTSVTTGDKIFLDRDAETCDAENEGCHEFVRAGTGLAANLLINSSFEDDLSVGIWSGFGATTSDSYDGRIALVLPAGASSRTAAVGASASFSFGGFNIGGNPYTLSLYAKNCASSSDSFQINGQPGATALGDGSTWKYYQTSIILPRTTAGNQILLNFNRGVASGCTIDSIKLENSYKATAYSEYNNNGKVYERLMPGYLFGSCYQDEGTYYSAKDDAPEECFDFARQCKFEEVGCESFTSKRTDISVPAKVVAQDYCVAECDGFDAYMQTETYFDSQRNENFIPKSAQACSAAAAGCDQFTNLDEVAKGGEGIEYYSTLRQCIKPSASACNEFYAWEGSNDTGFQLRVVSLNFEGAGAAVEPVTTSDDSADCNADIYNRPATDPSYNADCREFYNVSGEKSYHLYARTISCDENCHPYRRTEVNTDPNVTTQGDCDNLDASTPTITNDTQWDDKGTADATDDVCYSCENGGTYDTGHRACIYNAIPDQGRACQASAAGCREYTGSTGRNEEIILNIDLEDGTRGGFTGLGATAVSTSNESVTIGGRSLNVTGAPYTAVLDVSQQVQSDKSYVLSFIAKSDAVPGTITVRVGNDSPASTDFGSVSGIGSEWQYYELNLAQIGHSIEATERLRIEGNGNFYIDNIRLVEIVDRYYLVKNSWQTPDACNQDLTGASSDLYMLGCGKYSDRNNQTHYLKSFTNLCNESAVGCEMLIDTQNSDRPEAQTWNDDPPPPPSTLTADDVTVPADGYIYAVYDKTKLCYETNKGCERLGKPYNYETDIVYSDVYLKNDPDKYSSIMCTVDAEMCGEYKTEAGYSYFKDPGDEICEWRQGYLADWGWYRKKIKRCNATGAACLENDDCVTGATCQEETGDTDCDTETTAPGLPPKTVGYGGDLIEQPANGWAGLCPTDSSGCNELIDPVSKFSINLIYNSDFSQNIDTTDEPERDGWEGNVQQVKIESNTLYRLAGIDSLGSNWMRITCDNALYQLDTAYNVLVSAGSDITLNLENQSRSLLFFSADSIDCSIRVNIIAPAVRATEVELKRAAVDYQVKNELDLTSCNGSLNFNNGCVLFNQRSQNGSGVSTLVYDADTSVATPNAAAVASENDSNLLVKASPDRVCDKWLACRSMLAMKDDAGKEKNYCFDIGLCNSLDDKGNCNNFLITDSSNPQNQTYTPANLAKISNLSGYNKTGFDWGTGTAKPGLYPYGNMRQVGETAEIPNGNFESSGDNGFAESWVSDSADWTENVFKVIDNPYEAQEECLNADCGTYVPEGRGFLKLGAGFTAASEYLDVIGDAEYVLSAYLNTVNLLDSRARVEIEERNAAEQILPTPGKTNYLTMEPGNPWALNFTRFRTEDETTRVKITLRTSDISTASGTGRTYFDNVTLFPVLETSDQTPALSSDYNFNYAGASCRLYPKTDSLSCDYLDDSGVRQKGWLGYCLEYDSPPGSTDACLTWWPVDRIKGDGLEEGGGYQGRYPVYYCTESRSMRFLEYRHAYYAGTRGNDDQCAGMCQAGYTTFESCNNDENIAMGMGCQHDESSCTCIPNNVGLLFPDGSPNTVSDLDGGCSGSCSDGGVSRTPSHPFDGWYLYDGGLTSGNYTVLSDNPQYAYLCDGATSCTFSNEQIKSEFSPTFFANAADLATMMGIPSVDPSDPPDYCSQLVQTVTPAGQNKYWSSRVYEGSDYLEACYANGTAGAFSSCLYSADYSPFGSIVYPEPDSNPYEWDAKSYDGIQPLYYEDPDTSNSAEAPYQPRFGQLHSMDMTVNGLERLFAKSYGGWNWATSSNYSTVEGRYTRAEGLGWNPPDTAAELCPGLPGTQSRPTFVSGSSVDYCAIIPRIDNISIDDNSVTINKNGFANLTFNSNLDNQQRPLVMYAIDWGDEEKTVVSGVEMNDRPYTDKPHSLYHMYSYWDLKSKAGKGVYLVDHLIDCSVANQCRVKPRVLVKDNWGWCNAGIQDGSRSAAVPNGVYQNPTMANDCNQYEEYSGWITVTEN
jgi:hypothetical protein